MRTYLILVLFFLFALGGSAQSCDIATTGVSSSRTTMPIGETADLTFNVYNDAQGSSCSYLANSVQVILALPNNGLAYQQIVPTAGLGSYFTWTYDSVDKVIIGINHKKIQDGQGENVTVRVIGTTIVPTPVTRYVTLNIQQNPLGPIFPSNNEANDNGTTGVTLTAALPIQLISFNGVSRKCKSVDLSWATASEKNNDYMEVMRSTDGKEFASVGKVKGTNTSRKTSYTFKDENGLVSGVTYYYRLKQVDFDGRTEMFDIITVDHSCPAGALSMSLFPNPAFDKVNVSLAGFSDIETVKLIVTNAIGEVMMTIPGATTKNITEISLNGLNSGVYSVKVVGYEDLVTKRFIKID